MKKIVILGNGISGITAARHIRKKSEHEIVVVSEESEYFFSRTALMYVYMGHMKFEHTQPYENWFWKKNRIKLVNGRANEIDTNGKKIIMEGMPSINYDVLIIATGSKPNKFGWPGQDAKGVMGMYHKQDLEALGKYAPNEEKCKRAVVVGGGLIGIELAEMLRSRDIPVTFLVRENSFWNSILPAGESEMLNKHIKEHHIDLRLGVNLQEIRTNENGYAKSVIVKETGEEILCDLVGLTAGVSPNIDILKSSPIETNRGVQVNRFLETNIPDVYAIGDCAEQHEAIGLRKPVESVWYTGRMMGETVANTICGSRTEYTPGHWFNSAKFLDIEYQTYGWVFTEPAEGNQHFHWMHRNGKMCITVEFNAATNEFRGINTFGIRMRHEVFNTWLDERRSVDYVMEHLHEANFDPEFYSTYESEVLSAYTNQFVTL